MRRRPSGGVQPVSGGATARGAAVVAWDAEGPNSVRCPCRKVSETITYEACCGPVHDGTRPAASGLALMRARYCAYALGDLAFVAATWHPATRPPDLGTAGGERWISLRIVGSEEAADEATVSFVARAQVGGRTWLLRETSRFRRENGRWLYVDGKVDA